MTMMLSGLSQVNPNHAVYVVQALRRAASLTCSSRCDLADATVMSAAKQIFDVVKKARANTAPSPAIEANFNREKYNDPKITIVNNCPGLSLLQVEENVLEVVRDIFETFLVSSKAAFWQTRSLFDDYVTIETDFNLPRGQASLAAYIFPYTPAEAFVRLICYGEDNNESMLASPLFINNLLNSVAKSMAAIFRGLGGLPQAVMLSEIDEHSCELVQIILYWTNDPLFQGSVRRFCYDHKYRPNERWLLPLYIRANGTFTMPQDLIVLPS